MAENCHQQLKHVETKFLFSQPHSAVHTEDCTKRWSCGSEEQSPFSGRTESMTVHTFACRQLSLPRMKTKSCQYKQNGQLYCCTSILTCMPITIILLLCSMFVNNLSYQHFFLTVCIIIIIIIITMFVILQLQTVHYMQHVHTPTSVALGSTQPLTKNEYKGYILEGKDSQSFICQLFRNSGSLNLL